MNNSQNTFYNYTISFGEAILFFFAIMIVAQIVMGLIAFPTTQYPHLNNILLPLSFFGGFGAAALMIMIIKRLNINELKHFFNLRIKLRDLLLAILLYFVSLPMAEYLSMIVPTEGYPILEEIYELFEESFKIIFEYPIAAFIMICIGAPLLEELIFRGLLLRGMLQKGINPWFSIIFTAFLFGIAHMNPWQFFGAGLLGAIFGFIYWRTQSLWIVIILHFINNFIAFIITTTTENLDETVFEPNWLILSASLILTIAVIYFLHKLTQGNEVKEVETTTHQFLEQQ